MTFAPRPYPNIVRDLLTTLTGGTVREPLTVPAGELPMTLAKLRERPVRRVSHLEGVIEVPVAAEGGAEPTTREVPYRFTAADFELVATDTPDAMDAIRFREGGRRPPPGSTLSVNYYPVQTLPTPLTDLNVGSVVRTMLETVARELTLVELQLQHVYDSAFLDTAEGSSLDKVAALVGMTRIPAGKPVVKVRLAREARETGRITVPAGTAVTDKNANRYRTMVDVTLEPGEASRDVEAAGDTAGTQLVEAEQIDRLEVLVAGISSVTNPEPARRLASPETDDQLRRRAGNGLNSVMRGTLDALRFGILSMPGVNAVTIVEQPNDIPGEIQIQVAYANDSLEVREAVELRIEELRPAGIRVLPGEATRVPVHVRVALELAGAGVAGSERDAVTSALSDRIATHLSSLAPGARARRAQLTRLALEDPRIIDATVTLTASGREPADELELTTSEVLDVVEPFEFVITSEVASTAAAIIASVDASIPILLVAGVTLAQAQTAMRLALESYLSARTSDQPLSVDGLLAAIRDETRYAVVRELATVVVESAGQFRQLTDGVGEYAPTANETLVAREIDIDAQEGDI